ncbi:RNA polymerase sigma factor [Streptomyces sp. BE303]|uniref:RNA polymerase sigma factor n=1 Tax=Streptomyces sp. BE303 TaxID=3002528 RepID=UPI002E777EAB|nr:sigma-70 family RNA polymerase sigma factor [Streptomyces sp. BE303]MED7947337.1 sigma-70 family RNA polymerase sigma factor [Streptomyces sp. BE303]
MAVLYARHHSAVLAFARSCVGTTGCDEDLASEAFTRVIAAVRSGHGPTGDWRPYLMTVVRNTATAWGSAERHTFPTADVGMRADRHTSVPPPDQILEAAIDHDLVRAAYHTLPERWRAALQHSAVEQRPIVEVARLLGLTSSGASSLVSRAREGLRRAYLMAHLQAANSSPGCADRTAQLAALARHPARRKPERLVRHLDACAKCRHRYEEMRELNRRFRLARTALVQTDPKTADRTGDRMAHGSAAAGPV